MRKGLSLIAIMAVLAQGPAFAVPAPPPAQADAASRQAGAQGLCRKPAALPVLDAETAMRPKPPVRPGKVGDDKLYPPAPVAMEAPGPPPPPPPPAPTPPPPPVAGGVEVSVTGARVADPAMAKMAAMPEASADVGEGRVGSADMPPRHHPRPRPQAGQLTAGEHDDLLNPELYADYVRRSDLGQAIPDLPRVDTQRTLTVAVNDRAGRPVPFANVELACADGGRITLATTADGKVTFFPEVDQLGRDVWVRTKGEDWRTVSIPASRGAQRIDFTVDRTAAAVRKLDLMLVVDTTGSMGDEIRYLQSELAAIIDGVKARHPQLDLRLGFVFYRDTGDDYVTSTVPLSANIAAGQWWRGLSGSDGSGPDPRGGAGLAG